MLLIWILLEHPVPTGVGLVGFVIYLWHRLAVALEPDESPIAKPSTDRQVWEAMQRVKTASVTRAEYTPRKVS